MVRGSFLMSIFRMVNVRGMLKQGVRHRVVREETVKFCLGPASGIINETIPASPEASLKIGH